MTSCWLLKPSSLDKHIAVKQRFEGILYRSVLTQLSDLTSFMMTRVLMPSLIHLRRLGPVVSTFVNAAYSKIPEIQVLYSLRSSTIVEGEQLPNAHFLGFVINVNGDTQQ